MKTILHRILILALPAYVLTFSSCSEPETDLKNEVLVEATPFLTRTASELRVFMQNTPLEIDPERLKYDVEIFKVTYKTMYRDEEVVASGVVVLPKTTDEVGMVSFQHGTIVAQNEAPSALPLNNTQLILYAALGSAGFIGVVPDYIGFGQSKDIFHPYYIEEATADAVIDNLKAARELGREKDIKFNERLFLAGYSQGGYATMAAHKAIETDGLDNFDLIASFPAAGGYNVKGVQEYFFERETYDQPYYMAYVALGYMTYYDWTTVLTDFFQEPFATRIPDLFNGTNSSTTINSQLTDNIPELVQPDLIEKIDTDIKYEYLVDAFEENSLVDWVPQKRMYLYHGDADTTVPYENSVSVYNTFIAMGASPEVVTFTPLPGEDHGSGVFPYLQSFIDIVLELK